MKFQNLRVANLPDDIVIQSKYTQAAYEEWQDVKNERQTLLDFKASMNGRSQEQFVNVMKPRIQQLSVREEYLKKKYFEADTETTAMLLELCLDSMTTIHDFYRIGIEAKVS